MQLLIFLNISMHNLCNCAICGLCICTACADSTFSASAIDTDGTRTLSRTQNAQSNFFWEPQIGNYAILSRIWHFLLKKGLVLSYTPFATLTHAHMYTCTQTHMPTLEMLPNQQQKIGTDNAKTQSWPLKACAGKPFCVSFQPSGQIAGVGGAMSPASHLYLPSF